MTVYRAQAESWRRVGMLVPPEVPKTAAETEYRAWMRMKVARALCEDRVLLAFQAVVSAGPVRNPAFQEALVRLIETDGTLISAGEFMPLVDRSSLGRALDCTALRQTLAMLAGNPGLRLSVNISPRSIGNVDWMAILAQACRNHPGVGFRLIVEITEMAALENNGITRAFLAKLREYGCAVALDDFGAGATAFRHFLDFRFDVVKIDGAFITGLAEDRGKQVLVKALVQIAQHFEMLSVAEFVETEADAVMAAALGVDCLQGYLIGRPRTVLPDRPEPALRACAV